MDPKMVHTKQKLTHNQITYIYDYLDIFPYFPEKYAMFAPKCSP